MRICAVYIRQRDALVFLDICGVTTDIELFNKLSGQMYFINRQASQTKGLYGIEKLPCQSFNTIGTIECIKFGNTFDVSLQSNRTNFKVGNY
jgi:hypothetical protein